MNTTEKLVAAARRAARRHAAETGLSHQKSLDAVARRVGRPTWSAFLADPVPVDDQAIEAAAEPDFSSIGPDEHAVTIIRHARRLRATAFTALPRSAEDVSPVLSFVLGDGRPWPVDARGLSIDAVADACLQTAPRERPSDGGVLYDLDRDMPTIDGALMRVTVRTNWHATPEVTGVSASIDGSEPPSIEHITMLSRKTSVAPVLTTDTDRTPKMPLRRRVARMLRGANRTAIAALISRGPLNLEDGPVVAFAGRKRLRLTPGFNLCAFSPPGTGRMAGITIPALLTDDGSSYVVHDDGQLLQHTSGWRSRVGRVAVIRLDGDTRDAINPFDARWLPEPRYRKSHADHLARAIASDDRRVSRLIAETACELIDRCGSTDLRAIRDAIAADGRPFADEALHALTPLVDPLAHAATSRSTIGPEMLRGDLQNRPITIYIVRDPTTTGSRDRLAAFLQTAIWLRVFSCRPEDRPTERARTNPLPLRTILHDFHRLPAIPMLTKAMDMARSFGCGTIITGSTATTIAARYEEDGAIIVPMSHIVLVPEQSDAREMGLIDPYGRIEWEEAAMIGKDCCIALGAGGMPPARLAMAMYFRDREMLDRVWNLRTGRGHRPVA